MNDSLNNKAQDYLNRLENLQSVLQSSSTKAWIDNLPSSEKNKIQQFKTNLGNYIDKIRNKRLKQILRDSTKEEDIKAIHEGINNVEHQINKLNDTVSFLNATSKLIKTLTNVFGFLPLV